MIGIAILFQNADCGHAMQHFPPDKITDSIAVSFVTHPQGDGTEQQQTEAKSFVASKIARLKVNRREFDEQSVALVRSAMRSIRTKSTIATW